MTQFKAAIVTGASRGIGRQVALRLGAAGYSVLVNYASNQENALLVVKEITQAGGKALAMAGDVTQTTTANALFDRAEEEFGPVQVLVNNAGVATSKWLRMHEIDDDTYDHVFDVNTRGTFHMLRVAAQRLADGGRIVNFSSSLVASPMEGLALYTATKAAVEAFTKVLAK